MGAPLVLPLDSPEATLAMAGGKAANLSRLIRAGFSVPGGFVVTTEAYRAFVQANGLAQWIPATAQAVRRGGPDEPEALEAASQQIAERFAAGEIPPIIASTVRSAYSRMGSPVAAVRSSATAEDLPDLSFAGQQSSFLNVTGDDALLRALADCWSSLWTARAIGYRARNGVAHSDVSLAVVVQVMVASEASGVLFTANPLTGKRPETVIDATLGLGEALVAGRVDPDHYVVDAAAGRIASKKLGAKAERSTPATTAEPRQALPDSQIIELASLGRRVAELFGAPQDIEWAWADGRLWLVQARPITSLYPLPEGLPAEPLRVLLSVGAVQGMLDPMTPLGQDMLRVLGVEAAGRRVGLRIDAGQQRFFWVAGERLFYNITGAIRHPLARRRVGRALSQVEPATAEVIEKLLSDPRLAPHSGKFPWRFVARLARVLLPTGWHVLRNLWRPNRARARIERRIAEALGRVESLDGGATLGGRLAALDQALDIVARTVVPYVASGVMAGLGSLGALRVLAAAIPGGAHDALEATRAMPHNVTTEMDLSLWKAARAIQQDPASAARFAETEAATLAADYAAGRLPAAAQSAVAGFLGRYGMRGLAEIDIGRPRWREEPAAILQVLQSYLTIPEDRAPDAMFTRGAQSAAAAIERLVKAIGSQPGGWLRGRVARRLAHRMRELAGLRESPKFFFVRVLGILRERLLAIGRDLVTAGLLERPADIFFLRAAELRAIAAGERRGLRALVDERRARYTREMRRSPVPRVLLSDGQAFYGSGASGADAEGEDFLAGSAVSPGVAEGAVKVVFDPRTARLAPGDILVCPGTDPAWTPLFLVAGGLVTEVGGLMTHGAVVAREYGIPAVVGVREATRRLEAGRRVRVDGSAGRVTLLKP